MTGISSRSKHPSCSLAAMRSCNSMFELYEFIFETSGCAGWRYFQDGRFKVPAHLFCLSLVLVFLVDAWLIWQPEIQHKLWDCALRIAISIPIILHSCHRFGVRTLGWHRGFWAETKIWLATECHITYQNLNLHARHIDPAWEISPLTLPKILMSS